MAGPQRPAAPVSRSVDALRRQFGLGRVDSLGVLAARWSDLVPDGAADQSEVVELRAGVLTVDAFDPGTAEVLNWSKQRLLAGVREACPDERIDDVSVRVRRRQRR